MPWQSVGAVTPPRGFRPIDAFNDNDDDGGGGGGGGGGDGAHEGVRERVGVAIASERGGAGAREAERGRLRAPAMRWGGWYQMMEERQRPREDSASASTCMVRECVRGGGVTAAREAGAHMAS